VGPVKYRTGAPVLISFLFHILVFSVLQNVVGTEGPKHCSMEILFGQQSKHSKSGKKIPPNTLQFLQNTSKINCA